ncbi:replicative DNA helicase [Candidatus Saccharibacteria bacterium]|nr:replicative DNA helicase [Candidatus Saccharibacteria bacterium]MBQ9017023.1 replicative DNA helicase [Candidatus Saccharibacteria bacterium]
MEETTRSSSGGRIPPQDVEAEKSLLGAILISDESFSEILERVKAPDFYEDRHQKIFAAMTALYNNHRPIDLQTMNSELKSEKVLKAVGGASYLAELTNFVPSAAHAETYADLIAEAATRRRLIKAGGDIVEEAYDSQGQIGDIVGKAEKTLFEVSDRTVKNTCQPISSILIETFDRIEELHRNKGALRGLKTGFIDLDKKLAGFQKGTLVIVGARPAMGKTTFAQNLVYNMSTINKKHILFFTMEMAATEIVERMVAAVANVDAWKIRQGTLSDEDFSKISDALGEIDDAPILFDDTSNMNILELRNKARRAAHDYDLGAIVIDYLQLLDGTDRYAGNRVQEVTEISRGLKTIARELEIPVIALAQLSRNLAGRPDPRPILSDLRESGSIEQDADVVMFIHRPDYYHQNEDDYEPTNITELLIEKHRQGPTGRIDFYFDSEHNRFLSLDKTRD